MKKLLIASLVAGLASVAAHAESNYNNTTGTTASAKLDFKVVIPKVLFLQVGTGTLTTNNTSVDELVFSPTAANLGNGTAVAGTGGDLNNGRVTVRVLANGGDVTLNNSNTGPMTTPSSAATIGWDKILVSSAALGTPTNSGWSNAAISHPAFNTTNGGGNGTAVTIAATNGVVKTEGMWTFTYANDTIVGAGTYGSQTNKGRVTYTATTP